MKSVITQGATLAKAIEEALKKADMPQEFFVKLLENAQAGFLGFGGKKAKIALFFKENVSHVKSQESLFEKGSYENLFNNPNIRKQIDQKLKEMGLEIQPIDIAKKAVVSPQQSLPQQSLHKNQKMHMRPLAPTDQQHKRLQNQNKSEQNISSHAHTKQSPLIQDSVPVDAQQSAEEFRRKRRHRYYRPRNRSQQSPRSSGNNTSGSNDSDAS